MKDTLNLQEIIKEHCRWLRGEGGRRADLRDAYLRGAELQGAYLRGADLQGAYLQGAYLRGADLRGADLRGADLRGADLQGVISQTQVCPQEGSFVAWKCGRDNEIIKLEIPADAKRLTAISSRKCRASKAIVLGITKGESPVCSCRSKHDLSLTYTVGGMVIPDMFDDDPRVECSHGLHFFITREEAEEWGA